jgi:nucleoside-diphosphate-sugar epimerase
VRIAVLGATGVAGTAFVPRARAAGNSVVVQRADIFDRRALVAFLDGCDAVVNLATSIPKPGGRGDWTVNDRIRREGTANLLAACLEAGVGIVLQQSVAMLHCVADDRPQTEDDPIEGYGVLASAFDMEALVRGAPLDGRLVRGGLLYGPGTAREELWIEEVRNGSFRVPGDGSAWLSPVHVDDFAGALVQILKTGGPNEPYIVCDDQPLRLHELYARVAVRAGVDTPKAGGAQRMRSFRVSNAKLRSLGWKPLYSTMAL